MIALLAAHRLWVLFGSGLVALGVYVVLHPELFRGASLILLGAAALERGSVWVRRLFRSISRSLGIGGPNDGQPRGGLRGAYRLIPRRHDRVARGLRDQWNSRWTPVMGPGT